MAVLGVESWIWYSAVAVVAGSRYISRRLTLGAFRKYQLDDYLMMFALCTYTTLIVSINYVYKTSSNLLPPGFDVNSLSKQDIREREFGSKLILVVEQCQCATIWLTKACVLLLYLHITEARRTHIAIKCLAVYVLVGYVVMEILYFGVWCRPFHEYWAVPTNSSQCSAATHHLITNAVLNLSSDCILLALGLPLFLRMNLPWQRKGALIGIFSLGLFVILAAVLNKIYSFTEPYGSKWTYWYVRESSTAMLVSNLPFVWTFWLRISRYGTAKGMSRVSKSFLEKSIPSHSNTDPADSAGGYPTRFRDSKQLEHGFAVGQQQGSDDDLVLAKEDLELGHGTAAGATALAVPGGGNDDGGLASVQRLSTATTRKERVVSFAEMLGQDCNPAANTDKEPTIYTHPQLFYSKRHTLPPAFEDAVLADTGYGDLLRRSSSADAAGPSRGASGSSCGAMSMNTQRAGSFV